MPKITCPLQFIGVVEQVDLSTNSAGGLDNIIATLSVTEVVRGVTDKTKIIKVLKGGPIVFNKGDTFELEMNNNLICHIKKHIVTKL